MSSMTRKTTFIESGIGKHLGSGSTATYIQNPTSSASPSLRSSHRLTSSAFSAIIDCLDDSVGVSSASYDPGCRPCKYE